MALENRFNRNKSIQEEAHAWFAKIEQGLTAPEKQALVAWLNQDQKRFNALKSLSNNHPILTQLNGLFTLDAGQSPSVFSKLLYSLCFVTIFCVTALFLLNATSIIDLPYINGGDNYKKEYASDIGQSKTIELNDGSTIFLNTNSVIEVDYSKQYRHITLTQGEAQFTVAKDNTRPFSVFIGKKSYTALGTVFNLQKTANQDTELLVTEGTVLVSKAKQLLNTTEIVNAITTLELPKLVKGSILTAGQKATVTDDGKNLRLEDIDLDKIQKDLAWQQGMLIFDGEPLHQVLTEVARYSDKRFEIKDKQLSHLKVAGFFKTGDISALLTSLNYNFDISHAFSGDTIIISSKRIH